MRTDKTISLDGVIISYFFPIKALKFLILDKRGKYLT